MNGRKPARKNERTNEWKKIEECECNLSFGHGIGIGKISVTTLILAHAYSIVPDCIAVDADILCR